MKRLYVMSSADRHGVKIGCSGNPRQRASDLGGKKTPLRIHYTSRARPNAFQIERAAHKLANKSRIDGEWFELSPADAIAIIKEAAKAPEAVPPLPKKSPVVILAVRLPPALKRQIELAARADDRSVPDWVRRQLKIASDKGRAK